MSIRNLAPLFNPASVAVIGASAKPQSVGATVYRNLLGGGFHGPIWAVNPKHRELNGHPCFASIADLPETPALAIVCTPPAQVPKVIDELGRRGTRAAIVLSAGLAAPAPDGRPLRQHMLEAARPYLLRILGPNCVGMLVPGIGLNASFAHVNAKPGRVAFVSQSGAMVTAVLDWANSRGIGFSRFISLGDSADIDFGDLLDYLARDPETDAILLYMEAATSARKFMSAARAAARSKPTLVVKSGRVPAAAKAAASHTGAMAGSDEVYDAAIRRAGMLRVDDLEELFEAVETLARAHRPKGERLAILTNGGGPGVMATDSLIAGGGVLAELSPATIEALDRVLPGTWSRGNPVDIIGDAPAERWQAALEILQQDSGVDSVLVLQAPTAIVPAADIARALAPMAVEAHDRASLLGCWLGGDGAREPRKIFADAGIPVFDTPEEAVHGYLQMVRYRRNQELLMEVPALSPPPPAAAQATRARARALIQEAIQSGTTMLSEAQAKAVLAAYGVPVVQTRIAHNVAEAIAHANEMGFPVALKILSPDIVHKTDVGGVLLDIANVDELRTAADNMLVRIKKRMPTARLTGFTVQHMVQRPEGRELIVGLATDKVFGPAILFGAGGVAVEIINDHAIALPPLNDRLARDLIMRTRVSRLLGGYRHCAPADVDAIVRTLVAISDMAADLPELAELDINPLLADANGVLALDARMRVAAAPVALGHGTDRFAIRPYPSELEQDVEWDGKSLMLRPIRPEDAAQHRAFFHRLDPEDVHSRSFSHLRELLPNQLARLTQIDYDREMAFIATRTDAQGQDETLGVARAVTDPNNIETEFAVIVRSDLKGRGLGRMLLAKLVAYCRSRGTRSMVGTTMRDNGGMLALARELGFETRVTPDGEFWDLRLDLQASPAKE